MTLPLTPAMLVAAYEYLRTTPPFRGWKLPHADEVEFAVLKRHDREGEHCTYRATGDHYIGVSAYKIGTTKALMEVMGHEMIHAHQEVTKTAGPGEHNAEFYILAGRACRYHGWDRKLFV